MPLLLYSEMRKTNLRYADIYTYYNHISPFVNNNVKKRDLVMRSLFYDYLTESCFKLPVFSS